VTNLVRKALSSDVAPLLNLIQQHAAFEQAIAHVTEGDVALVLDMREPPTRLIVAEERGKLTGYAALTFDYALWSASRFAHLDCLFVCANARGQGIGKLLFDHACHMAGEAGAQSIEWQTPAWNADAIRFYKREGGIGQIKMRFSKNLSAQSSL
jgi:GNAT superfamily N-acetyltransferase